MDPVLELGLRREGGRVELLAPEVGLFTRALPAGHALAPGQAAGALLSLGRAYTLVAPEGASGKITSPAPERVHAPVGIGDVLYVLAPGAAASAPQEKPAREGRESSDLVLRAPQAGRFYHRPAPAERPFVTVGQTIEDGEPVGMIEVMKTFSHVHYRATGGLPRRARVVRIVAADDADVKQGEPLLEVESTVPGTHSSG